MAKLRQYVIVPYKPKMSAGKIAAQVAHATFMAIEKQRQSLMPDKIIEDWKSSGMCVIVLGCKNTEAMWGMNIYLNQWDMIHHLYIDEGVTEIPPGTPTALATGIIDVEKDGWMFENFKVFKRGWRNVG